MLKNIHKSLDELCSITDTYIELDEEHLNPQALTAIKAMKQNIADWRLAIQLLIPDNEAPRRDTCE